MRLAQMTTFRRPLQIVELPVVAPRADGPMVRVEASGVCRSDWHFWNQDLAWMGLNLALPANTGHEVWAVMNYSNQVAERLDGVLQGTNPAAVSS